MVETHLDSQETPATAGPGTREPILTATAAAAEPPASPASPVSDSSARAVDLPPPQHWANQPLPEEASLPPTSLAAKRHILTTVQDDADSAYAEDAASSTASISSSILHYRTINGRTYHSDRGNNNYWGANDDRQNNTQDILHHSFTLALDGKLYLAPLPKHIDKALDVGTGTGIWAIDFADERPDTEVIGTDLSPIQPTWVPPNMTFQIDDFCEPWTFPDNSIDFVYGRWLVGSVINWIDFFRNAYRVLKPGGWIESLDFDGDVQCDDDTMTDKMAVAQWGSIFRQGGLNLKTGACYNPVLEGVQRKGLEEAGFVNITDVPHKIPFSEWPEDPKMREVGQFFRVALSSDAEGVITYMASQIGWTPADIAVYSAHYRRELRSLNVHGYYRGNTAYAQKPLN